MKFQASLRAALLAAFAVSGVANAQPVAQNRDPETGVDRTYHDYSSEGDASSLELNPALLGTIEGLDITLLGYRALSRYARGTGFGAFSAVNVFGVALGFGVQSLQPGLRDVFDPDAAQNPNVTKLSFGLAAGDREHASLGIGLHGIRSEGRFLRQPDLDVGLVARIFNFASLGVSAHFGPAGLRADGTLPAAATLVAEASVRPFGTRHVEVGGGLTARLYETNELDVLSRIGTAGLMPRGRVALRYQGLALMGEVERLRTTLLDETSGAAIRQQKGWRGSVSLSAAWDFVSAGAGIHAGLSDGVDGVGFVGRFTTARQGRAFWLRRVDAERIDLSAVDDERSLIAMLGRLERAREGGDRTILLVDARGTSAGWASLQEIRQGLVAVRDAGGHVFAYVEDVSLQDYYVATAAERIFMHPAGELGIYGLSSTMLYFKGALDKLGVRAEALHIAEYKSAHEMWTRTDPSPHDFEQRTELGADTLKQVLFDVAKARGLTLAAASGFVDDAPLGPEQAVDAALVDEVIFRDELLEKMSDILGAKVSFAPFPKTAPDPTWGQTPYVGVVLIEGTIIEGKSRQVPFLGVRFTGSDTIAASLRELGSDPSCKAIVLRVNSPGGSALASDIIWRQVAKLSAQWKKNPRDNPPIVVSMGDVAASGGYYVAMGAQSVFASETTITGSIGVVSVHYDLSGLLEKLGISTATFKQGKNADIGSPFAPYTDDQRARLETSMRRVYDLFIKRVSEGRGLDTEKVDELGRGHVYSGVDAKAAGLIDELGGLEAAITAARKLANVSRRKKLALRVFPPQPSLLDLLLSTTSIPDENERAALRAHRRHRKLPQISLPAVLTRAVARVPLSLLFLPQDRALVLSPGLFQVQDRAR